jgi:predicted dithiol-disulfide oxidoreductase (DUF899 family)
MKNDGPGVVKDQPVVSHEEWLAARQAFLLREKEFTRLRDELNAKRRALPWELITKQYVFDTPKGKRTLGELFDGRSQLVVYHAMFNPKEATPDTSWTEDAACQACSFWLDNFNGIITSNSSRENESSCAVSHDIIDPPIASVGISSHERRRIPPRMSRQHWAEALG